MFCSHCGTSISDNVQSCPACGKPTTVPQSVISSPATGFAGTASHGGIPQSPPETSGKAIASLILGLLWFLWPAAVAAIILGHISRSQIRKSGGRLKGAGMALVGLIFGYFGVTLIPILIIAAIAIPNLLRARIVANEASAVSSLHTVVLAQKSYANTYPEVGFSCDLRSLGGRGGSDAGAGLIDDLLARGQKSGYRFEISNCAGSPHGSYNLLAYPVVPNTTGGRAFCADESGVIKVDDEGSAKNCITSGVPLS